MIKVTSFYKVTNSVTYITLKSKAIMQNQCFKIFEQKYVIELMISLAESDLGFNVLQEKHTINTSTLQKRLLLLERVLLVTKNPCPHDGRYFFYSATEKGKAIAKILIQLQKEFRR